MKRKRFSSIILALAVTLALPSLPGFAQDIKVNQTANTQVKTDSRMIYHNGEVIHGTPSVYIIWYGDWRTDVASQIILSNFLSGIGSTPYFQINSTYPDGNGNTTSGDLTYAGGGLDQNYSHGSELTASDIQGIVADQILGNALPLDPAGIYLVFASRDVSSTATGFCIPNAPPHHGHGVVNGSTFRYGFVGSPLRCPSAYQFIAPPTPNDNPEADAMVSTIAHVLNAIVTNPLGDGWFDRYGLENADKCAGTYGQTFLKANGSQANVRTGYGDFMIQQNWVNGRKGRCALSQ